MVQECYGALDGCGVVIMLATVKVVGPFVDWGGEVLIEMMDL